MTCIQNFGWETSYKSEPKSGDMDYTEGCMAVVRSSLRYFLTQCKNKSGVHNYA